jgi:WD40 repeat protein
LKGHTDEVWHISYSHDGKYLASLSKDKTGIIWNMEVTFFFKKKKGIVGRSNLIMIKKKKQTFEQIQSFETEVSSSYCAWSPDDSKLLVCGTDFSLRLWDPHSGVLLTKFSHHKEQVTSCVWLPDGEHFISGACDKRLCLWVKWIYTITCTFN